jgi:hypothetical protein
LKIMAEFDLGEPNFEVLRKASACDDDRHFSKTLQNSMRLRVTHRRSGLDQGSIRAPQMQTAFLGRAPRRNGDFEGLSSL